MAGVLVPRQVRQVVFGNRSVPAKAPPRIEPRPADDVAFLHGLLEGIADIEALGYRRLAELGAPYPDVVYSSGGGAANAVWRQIRQRRLGIPVVLAGHTEAAYGTAMLARAGWTTG